jgi:hypothetical protein
MKRLAFLAAVACLWGCALPGTGKAGPATYIESFTASGLIFDTPFSNALVTLTFTGDTDNITSPASGLFFNLTGTATVNVAGITANFRSPAGVFAFQGTPQMGPFQAPEAGFVASTGSNTTFVNATQNSVFATYDLTFSIGPVTGPSFMPASQFFLIEMENTSEIGSLFIGSVGAQSTFQTDSFLPPTVPEPASLTLLGVTAAGILGYRLCRRR